MKFNRSLPVLCLCGVLIFASACRPHSLLVGRWCTDPPASLLYEYLPDGSVHLFIESGEYHVFRYQLPGENTLRLYDGMGRSLDYFYTLDGDTVVLSNPADPDTPVDHLTPPAVDGTCKQ
jgi:hypothetical protein